MERVVLGMACGEPQVACAAFQLSLNFHCTCFIMNIKVYTFFSFNSCLAVITASLDSPR